MGNDGPCIVPGGPEAWESAGWTQGAPRLKNPFSGSEPPWGLLRPVARPVRWLLTLRSPMVSWTSRVEFLELGGQPVLSTCPTMSSEVVVTRN